MLNLLAVGDNLVDCYPERGQMFPGGNCLNVAVQARRAGLSASYLGAVGTDEPGRIILGALAQEDVGFDRGRVIEGASAYCVIGHRDGDREFLDWDVGVSEFTLNQGDLSYAARHTVVHSAQASGMDSFVGDIADQTLVSYDFSTRREESFVRPIARHCYMATFSGSALTEDETEDLTRMALGAGAQWVLLTRGAAGATLTSATARHTVEAAAGEVVDTLGAGDTFIARVLAGLIRTEPPERFLVDAARRAAQTCTHYGAIGHGAPYLAGQLEQRA